MKMPEPATVTVLHEIPYYTEKQMKQYGRDLLEAAAQVCDRFQARNVGMQPAECAGAIRSMKETL